MHLFVCVLVGAHTTLAYSPAGLSRRSSYTGIATFNDYSSQGMTVCGIKNLPKGIYGAAASDVSPHIQGAKCSGSLDYASCSGQNPVSGYVGPACTKGGCGKCYKVTNKGSANGGSVKGVGNSVVVQIIDSCPSSHAANYCKTNLPANQRCCDPATDQLDIDRSAYQALTGLSYGSGPNLQIQIDESPCKSNLASGQATVESVDTFSAVEDYLEDECSEL